MEPGQEIRGRSAAASRAAAVAAAVDTAQPRSSRRHRRGGTDTAAHGRRAVACRPPARPSDARLGRLEAAR